MLLSEIKWYCKINSFTKERNHPLSTSVICEMAPRFRKLTSEMLADIENMWFKVGWIQHLSFLCSNMITRNIQCIRRIYAIYQFRQKSNPGGTDASQMLQQLMEWKESEPLWIVKFRLESVSRKLTSLLWMSPIQRELYGKYNDVVIVDTTYNTNRFQMMLCVITVVDNNYKTRIVACAIIEDKTLLDTYRWIFDKLLNVSPAGNIFTDSDPAMIRSIKDIYPDSQHLLCIFHIDLNLRKKLKAKLGIKFE